MAGMFICNGMEKRYDIVSMFYEMEVTEEVVDKQPFTTGYMHDFLAATRHIKFSHAMTGYIEKIGRNVDLDDKLNPDEYVVDTAWVQWKVGSDGDSFRRVLLVFTNRSFSRYDEPYGIPCSSCPPENFCPSGPQFVQRFEYSRVFQLFRGCDGCGFRLMYYLDNQRTLSSRETFVVYDGGVLDKILKIIIRFGPKGDQKVPLMVCDEWTPEIIRTNYLSQPKESDGDGDEQDKRENIHVVYSFEKCAIQQREYKEVMVVISTHQNLYFLHTNYSKWMNDNEEENEQFLETIPGVESPIKFSMEWIVRHEIEESTGKPCIQIDAKKASKREGGGQNCIFRAYFKTFTECQVFWQAIQEAKMLSDGKGPTQAKMNTVMKSSLLT